MEIIVKLCQLRSRSLCDRVHALLVTVMKEFRNRYGKVHPSMESLSLYLQSEPMDELSSPSPQPVSHLQTQTQTQEKAGQLQTPKARLPRDPPIENGPTRPSKAQNQAPPLLQSPPDHGQLASPKSKPLVAPSAFVRPGRSQDSSSSLPARPEAVGTAAPSGANECVSTEDAASAVTQQPVSRSKRKKQKQHDNKQRLTRKHPQVGVASESAHLSSPKSERTSGESDVPTDGGDGGSASAAELSLEHRAFQQLEELKRRRAERLQQQQQHQEMKVRRAEKIRQTLQSRRLEEQSVRHQESVAREDPSTDLKPLPQPKAVTRRRNHSTPSSPAHSFLPSLNARKSMTPMTPSSFSHYSTASARLPSEQPGSAPALSDAPLSLRQRRRTNGNPSAIAGVSATATNGGGIAQRRMEIPAAVRAVLSSHYQRPLQTLFKIYCNKRPAANKVDSFAMLAHTSTNLGFGDFMLLFQDLHVVPEFLNKLEVSSIFHMYQTYREIDYEAFLRVLWYLSLEITIPSSVRGSTPAGDRLPDNLDDVEAAKKMRNFVLYLRHQCKERKIGPSRMWEKRGLSHWASSVACLAESLTTELPPFFVV